MARKTKLLLPKLTPRGKKGNYYFRTLENGKDKWINTHTTDEAKAREYQQKVLEAKDSMVTLNRVENDSRKLSDMYVKSVTGKDQSSILLDDALEKWISTQPHYYTTSEDRRKNHLAKFSHFIKWCKSKNILYIEQVSTEVALQYASHLSEEQYAGSTYNEIVALLSNIFDTLDKIFNTSNRNPFDKRIVPRVAPSKLNTVEHKALEPDELHAVLKEAAGSGQDILDLFILASQTGMRLKDSALCKFQYEEENFLYFQTKKTGIYARPPITKLLREMLNRRKQDNNQSEYVIPSIAGAYLKDKSQVSGWCKKVFERVFGKENTYVESGNGRRIRTAIYSFHSFRSTYMSLLAIRDVSIRDAMYILGWTTQHMVQKYERLLEAARGDTDRRTFELVTGITQLDMAMPDIPPPPLRPNSETLRELITKYSNITIGKIYGVSNVAVGKWLRKYNIKRDKLVLSSDVTDEEIKKIKIILEAKNNG